MLAAIGVEGVYPEPSEDAESLMANSTSGTRSGQSSHRSPAKERRTSAMTLLTRSTLLVVLWWCWEPKSPEDERRPERLVQTRPEGAREARVAVLYEHVGQSYVAEHRSDEVAGRSLSRGCLGGRDQV